MALNDDLRAALIQQLDSKFKENELAASGSIAKYDKSTQTYYADEELAIKKVPQVNSALIQKLKDEEAKKASLEDAVKEFAERLAIDAEYNAPTKKNMRGISVDKDGSGKWHMD